MALVSFTTLAYLRIAFFTLVSYYLIFDPKTVFDYDGVIVLSSAMKLPLLLVNEDSPIYGTIGVVLFMSIVSDLVPLLEDNRQYYEAVLPTKLLIFFCLASYSYLGSYVYLCNSIVFCYTFVEIWFSILMFSSLKDESQSILKEKLVERNEKLEKFNNGELSETEFQEFKKELENDEYNKIMQEFKN
ncbi:unnamed protein product [[Candida] boidinii]|uniref:Unnamed protein product n=1 Tax=Candida boidinii TaxID=5477 RepID=A0A9W6WIV4_CANBO|nr:hypothetical protein B5S30_g352 [[Candida] boidinii]OWB82827.1 hypothetical protein B5S33_g1455 [[Candida] boidinii]GME72661.1 unnamed protein product [[Candida] boidinii]GMF99493.1 unnamed protein product [[Candida] boidinii]